MSAVVAERHPLWLEPVTTRWREVLEDGALQDLPYKIETNRSGQVVMSPANSIHSVLQGGFAHLLKQSLGGLVLTGCAIATADGVKCADVAWASATYVARHGIDEICVVAPEICVEVESPSNAEVELQFKVQLYLDAGAIEVWLVDAKGGVRIFDRDGRRSATSFGVDIDAVARDLPYSLR